MNLLVDVPIWALALGIFLLRIFDVSLGTVRTISVVQGRLRLSVLIGFFEVLIWVTAVSQVIVGIQRSPVLILAYAGGFAAGNACGILLERRLGIGRCVVRMIVGREPGTVAALLRESGYVVTSFGGSGRDGPRTLLITSCPRRELEELVAIAAGVDPHVFYTVDRFTQSGHVPPLPEATGWRAFLKKK